MKFLKLKNDAVRELSVKERRLECISQVKQISIDGALRTHEDIQLVYEAIKAGIVYGYIEYEYE